MLLSGVGGVSGTVKVALAATEKERSIIRLIKINFLKVELTSSFSQAGYLK